MNKLLSVPVVIVVVMALALNLDVHPILNTTALLLFAGLIVYLGSQADYWRGRSREFYEFQQGLVDQGRVKYDEMWKTRQK